MNNGNMRVFIGSSTEAKDSLDTVAFILAEYGFVPVRWDKPGLFLPGENTFEKLQEISKEVDAAVFIFSEDDKVWYRKDAAHQPRDNVLIEYGMFAGVLGQKKAIFCVCGKPKKASDILGIQYIDISEQRLDRARLEIAAWAKSLKAGAISGDKAKDIAKIRELEEELARNKEKATFYEEVSNEYRNQLLDGGLIDDSDILTKFLGDFDFTHNFSKEVKEFYDTPADWAQYLKQIGKSNISYAISWEIYAKDTTRLPIFVRKSLRILRKSNDIKSFRTIIDGFHKALKTRINNLIENEAD